MPWYMWFILISTLITVSSLLLMLIHKRLWQRDRERQPQIVGRVMAVVETEDGLRADVELDEKTSKLVMAEQLKYLSIGFDPKSGKMSDAAVVRSSFQGIAGVEAGVCSGKTEALHALCIMPDGEHNSHIVDVTVEERPRRPSHGDCPGCGADPLEWCQSDCKYLDPLDYR